jgi:intracellular multiplication protein IcmK
MIKLKITAGVGVLLMTAQLQAETPPQLSSLATAQALQQLQQLQMFGDASRGNQNAQAAPAQSAPLASTSSANNANNANSGNLKVVMPSTYSTAQSGQPPMSAAAMNTSAVPATGAAVAPTTTSSTANTTTTPKSGPGSVTDPAFESVTSHLFPLSTAQVVKLHEMYNTAELASVTSPKTPPRPTETSQFVNLSTGSTPPVIRLAQGFVSSLVFLDSTGAPWPILSYDLGDPRSFNISWDRTGASNTLMIQSNKLYTYGNLAIKLQGLNTPVMLTLIPGQKAVDYRMDLRVQGYGPNAFPAQTQNLPPSANSVLLSVLDGVPPPGGKLLDITGGPAEAWAKDDRLYLRTRLKVLSPGWISVMSSADGMNAYEMTKTPVLLVSWRGKVLQLRVEGL